MRRRCDVRAPTGICMRRGERQLTNLRHQPNLQPIVEIRRDAPNDIARVVPYRPGLSGAHEAVAMSPVGAYGIR